MALAIAAAQVAAAVIAEGSQQSQPSPPPSDPPGMATPAAAPVPAPPAAGTATAAGGPLTLSQVIDLALAANRSLTAARLGRGVAAAQVALARERPNPDLAGEAARETPHQSLTLSQPLETGAKRRRRIALAEAGAGSQEAEIARTTAEVRSDARRAFYALAAAERRVAEAEDLARLSGRARDAARDRFDLGDIPRLEVLQAELGASRAEGEAASARDLRLAAQAELDALLGRPLQAPATAGGSSATLGVLYEGDAPDPRAAVDRALAASTELALLDKRLTEQAARLALANAERRPNPTVDAAVTHDSPPEFNWGWRAGFSFSLPLFTRHYGAVAVEEATLAQLRAEREAAAARIAGAVYSAATTAAARRQQALRFRDQILPRTLEVEGMAEDSYRSGQTGLIALLQALQTAHDVRREAVEAGYDYQVALADLERAMGAPLP